MLDVGNEAGCLVDLPHEVGEIAFRDGDGASTVAADEVLMTTLLSEVIHRWALAEVSVADDSRRLERLQGSIDRRSVEGRPELARGLLLNVRGRQVLTVRCRDDLADGPARTSDTETLRAKHADESVGSDMRHALRLSTPAVPSGGLGSLRGVDTGLAGKCVLVTGGAGGIGSAVVRAFAAEGASVGVHYHTNRGGAERLATETGGVALRADLTAVSDADALVPSAVESLGGLDVCVANAGVWPRDDLPVWELPIERWEATLRANLTATFLTARSFLRHAALTGSGSLVLVGSTAGIFGEAGHADYAAAKGGIISGLLLSAKNEAARIGPGVRVNAVAPGWTVTPMIGDKGLDQDHVTRATATMSLKKLGRPEDVAAQIVTLASDRVSGHVSGQVVAVAGGMEGRLIT